MQALELKKSSLFMKVLMPSLLINLLSLAVPLTVLQIYDRILPNQSYGTASLLIAGAFIALLMEAFLRFVRAWLLAAAASNTEKITYSSLLQKINLTANDQLNNLGRDGVSKSFNAVARVKEWYSGGVLVGLIDLPFAIIFLGLVYYIGGVLVLVPITVWLITLLIVYIASMQAKQLSEQSAANELQSRTFLNVALNTLQGIKRQAIESRIFQQFKSRNEQRFTSKIAEERKNALAQECIQLAALATSVILVIVGSLWVLSGDLTSGGLAACSILSGRAVAPLSALMGIRIRLNSMHSAKQAIEALHSLPTQAKINNVIAPNSQIQLKEISLANGTEQFSLEQMWLNPGDIVLLESQYSDLESHFLASLAGAGDSLSGSICIDDNPDSLKTLFASSAFCPANAQLISGSILDNLCGFDVNNTNAAIDFSKRLGLHNIITQLSEGLETKIGHSHSVPFSMGSIKRVALVAQLARPLPLVLLERPDVALDIESVNQLADTLSEEAKQGRIIVMVTYHPQLIALATKKLRIKQSNKGEVNE
ncbi:ABC transporter [Psychromonas sp. psych-6C06]|uniref:ABC transporter transmembrane domain-containing protein n=1 Tax=Psychromonas sp. psych-6C06 TaxID=2058089 RepID=UPI000C333677|nr:ABC transporter transmembrane domain-containing protein [Psychromonas sp. psych-6C06]PKF62455.1 ABC transporter [Psychromonas sp. psych-6C06]